MKAVLYYYANTNTAGLHYAKGVELEGADIHIDTEDVDSESGEGYIEVSVLDKLAPVGVEASDENVIRTIVLNAKNFIMLDRETSDEERTAMKAEREKTEVEVEKQKKTRAVGPFEY